MVKAALGRQRKLSMQKVSRFHSISTKLLISILLWVTCALVFTGYTLALLWQLENGGEAINKAGSLRMRVYHLVSLTRQQNNRAEIFKEQQNFTQILTALKTTDENSIFLPDNIDIGRQIREIEKGWQQLVLPFLAQYSSSKQAISDEDLTKIDLFVSDINKLVNMIEIQNTYHISWLRFIQTLLIIMVVFSAFTAIYLLYKLVIRPLRNIQVGIQSLSQGRLSKRISKVGKDEFGIVSAGFNIMAENLEDLYTNLEQKVNQKTAALEETNLELSALYKVTAFLHESTTQETMSQGFLNDILKLSGADAGNIRLLDKQHGRLNYIASINLSEYFLNSEHCTALNCYCGKVVKNNDWETHYRDILMTPITLKANLAPCMLSSFKYLINFHIHHNNYNLGLMTLFFSSEKDCFLPETQHLIEALTNQLAVALENQQLVQSDKQLAIMQERNLIAQGLHDSIAQSLSFLNMQIQMMQKAFKNKDISKVEKNLNFIQQGIQECYDDVRELLLNFRTRVSKEDFSEAIQSVLERFKQQAKVPVELMTFGDGPSLAPEQQLQIIFILQEALSNIRKHAQCSHVKVTFKNKEDFVMVIEDNGNGFAAETVEQKKNRHVGMSIMQERAKQIHGAIKVTSKMNEGTKVVFSLPKEHRGVL